MNSEFCNSFNKKRGRLRIDRDKCNFCGLCAKRCPHKSLRVDPQTGSWEMKLICMKCGRCVRECPREALSFVPFSEKK